MYFRFLLVFIVFFFGTFFLEAQHLNWWSRFLYAIFASGIIWLLQPNMKEPSKEKRMVKNNRNYGL